MMSRSDVPDAVYHSNNEWGVPLLLSSCEAQSLEFPIVKWGTIGRTERMVGTYHFYTDDYKFSALWSDPTRVLNTGCANVIEPNFSTGNEMPSSVALYNIYRKRWLSRFWQEYGVKVFVDLNVEPHFAKLNMLGVPNGWRAYATRAYATDQKEVLPFQFFTASERAQTEDIQFLVYGGGKKTRSLCEDSGWLWIPEDSDVKRGRY